MSGDRYLHVGLRATRRYERANKIAKPEQDKGGSNWLRTDRGPNLTNAARCPAYGTLHLICPFLNATRHPFRCSFDRVLDAATN